MPSDGFTARGGDWVLVWRPPGTLHGSRTVLDEVEGYLARHDDVPVTATGPVIPARVDSPEAVLAIVSGLHPDAKVSGDPPDLEALWRDEVPRGDDVVF